MDTRGFKLNICWRMLICTCFVLAIGIGCSDQDQVKNSATLPAALIGIYSETSATAECVQASECMFKWMGHSVVRLKAQDFQTGSLDTFDIICMPGGDMYLYASELGDQGITRLLEFISSGGGYIGICGGAYFAGESVYWRGSRLAMRSLGLFSGAAVGPLDEVVQYPHYGMCDVLSAGTNHIISSYLPDTSSILYYWGPAFALNHDTTIITLATYDIDQLPDTSIVVIPRSGLMEENQGLLPAILIGYYDSGRFFLTGVHPEIEENDDRDSTEFCGDLNDETSDWELMKAAVEWCLKRL